MAKAEKNIIENKSIADYLNKDFLDKLQKLNLGIFPVSLVFISEREINNTKQASPLLLIHQTSDEVKNRRLHIESPDTALVELVTNMLEEKQNE